MVTSEKRGKDTAKEERILCLQVRGFILLFQLAVCHWHLSLSSSDSSAPLGLLQWQAATSPYLLWFISSSLCSS